MTTEPNKPHWRTIITDTEGATGFAPVCTSGAHVITDTHQVDESGVYHCCPEPRFELFSETAAESVVARLNAGAPLAFVLRETHYPVDGSRTDDGSCIADGHDWPCPTITALAATETAGA